MLLKRKHAILNLKTDLFEIFRVKVLRDGNGSIPGNNNATEGFGNKEAVPAV